MSIRSVSFKCLLATACIAGSSLVVSDVAKGAIEDESVPPTAGTADADSSLPPASVPQRLFKPVAEGGAVPNGVQVERFESDEDANNRVILSGVSQSAEEIGVLAVQLEASGWLSDLEITTLTRRGRDRLFPWLFSIRAVILLEGPEQLSAR